MATNKKITELTELGEADLADDDVLPIVDISAGQTFKVRKSTLASALAGVASLAATTPVAVDQATGSVTVSLDTVPIASGGTGATTAAGARTNLGAISDPTDTRGDIITRGASALQKLGLGASGYFLKSDGTDPTWSQVAASDLTGSVNLTSQVTGTLPLANGGTNATTASGARTSLGLGSIATQDSSSVSITGGSISGISPGVTIEGSSSSDALRITQTGAGNALVVEDSANPDSTPFVVDAGGNVGIGASSPAVELEIASGQPELRFTDTDGTDQESTFVQAGGTLYLNLQNDTSNGAFRVRGFASGSPTDHFLVNGSGGVQVFKAAYNPITTDNDLSFNQAASNNFKCTPSGSGTLTFTNHTDGQSGNILLINTGGHAISLAATTKGDANLASTISTAGTYWLSYYDDGTNAYVVTSAVFA